MCAYRNLCVICRKKAQGEKDLLEEKTGYFPLFVDLSDKKIVVVGGGKIGTRRVKVLSQFTNHISVIALEVSKELQQLEKEGQIVVKLRPCQKEDFVQAFLVVAATNDSEVNDEVISMCKNHCFVNHAGDKSQSTFYFPGIVKEKECVIGVTASGKDHKLAKRITDLLKEKWSEYLF